MSEGSRWHYDATVNLGTMIHLVILVGTIVISWALAYGQIQELNRRVTDLEAVLARQQSDLTDVKIHLGKIEAYWQEFQFEQRDKAPRDSPPPYPPGRDKR